MRYLVGIVFERLDYYASLFIKYSWMCRCMDVLAVVRKSNTFKTSNPVFMKGFANLGQQI